MGIKSEKTIYSLLEKHLRATEEPVTCVDLMDIQEIRKAALAEFGQQDVRLATNKLSDALGFMWRRGLVTRFPAPKESTSFARYSYIWDRKEDAKPISPLPSPSRLSGKHNIQLCPTYSTATSLMSYQARQNALRRITARRFAFSAHSSVTWFVRRLNHGTCLNMFARGALRRVATARLHYSRTPSTKESFGEWLQRIPVLRQGYATALRRGTGTSRTRNLNSSRCFALIGSESTSISKSSPAFGNKTCSHSSGWTSQRKEYPYAP